MHQPVTHSPHQMPGNLGMSCLNSLGDVVSGLADDNKVELDSSDGFGVVPQSVECHAVRECLDLRYRVEDVLYALGPRSRKHEYFPLTRVIGCVASGCLAFPSPLSSQGVVPDDFA